MTRKELYSKVKELKAEEAIKSKFGDNYTRVSNADLEAFINGFGKKESKKITTKVAAPASKANNGNVKKAFVALLSTLQANKVIKAKDADEIASLL